MTTIAVIGVTGFAGSAITHEALSRGYDVIGAARDTASIDPADHLTTRDGDLYDTAFVDGLAADADVLIVAANSHLPDGRELPQAIPAIGESVARHQTRLGVIGGAGSLETTPGGPIVLETPDFHEDWKPEARAAYGALEALRRTNDDVNWFYVSPSAMFGAYADVAPRGTYRLGGDVLLVDDDGRSEISGPDFATAVVDEIASPTHYRERFTVGY